MGHLLQVEQQVVNPEADPLADRGGLCGLEVGAAEADEGLCLEGLGGQPLDHGRQAGGHEIERLADEHEVGVVGDEGARGPEVDDRTGSRTVIGEGVEMSKHVVPHPALVVGRPGKVDRVEVSPHFGELLRRDGQAQFGLALGEGQPDPPPERVAVVVAPQPRHLGGGVAGGKRVFPAVAIGCGGSLHAGGSPKECGVTYQ